MCRGCMLLLVGLYLPIDEPRWSDGTGGNTIQICIGHAPIRQIACDLSVMHRE
jgi:hypothetical protein